MSEQNSSDARLLRRHSCLIFVAAVFISACAPAIPDNKIQGDIAQKLTSSGINTVYVGVQNGIATLSGQVLDETSRNRSEALAKSVEGVKSVQSSVIVVRPTPEATPELESPETSADHYEQPESWRDRAMIFLEKFMEPRMVNCGGSWYFLLGKSLHQTKREIFVEIFTDEVFPAEELSEVDRLNGKKPQPETWQGFWGIHVEGPWRRYDWNGWTAWRDDPFKEGYYLKSSEVGKWEFPPTFTGDARGNAKYEKIGKYKCYGEDIDLESIPGSPVDK